MARRTAKRSVGVSAPKSVAELLRAGFQIEDEDTKCSDDEKRRWGTMRFVRRGKPIPIEQTEAFKRASKPAQRRIKGMTVEGEIIAQVAVPFRAKFKFGRPRRVHVTT